MLVASILRNNRWPLLITAPLLFAGYAAIRGASSAPGVARVPYVVLLATPKVVEGKTVEVRGFASVGFERNALYGSETDFLNDMDGIALNIPDALRATAVAADKRYVVVSGRFTTSSRGHLGAYFGSLTVQHIVSWSNPRCPVEGTGEFEEKCPDKKSDH